MVQVNAEPHHDGAPRGREELWRSWIRPLAIRHSHVTLVDQYVGKAIASSVHLKNGFGSDHPSEVIWLLGKRASLTPRSPSRVLRIMTVVISEDLPARQEQGTPGREQPNPTEGRESQPNNPRRNKDYRTAPDGEFAVTAERVENGIKTLWCVLQRERERWGFGELNALTVELITLAPKYRVHARYLRFEEAQLPSHRYLAFDAGWDRMRFENLGFKGGYWLLSYFVHTKSRQESAAEGKGATVTLELEPS
jgi:hypothetical protein